MRVISGLILVGLAIVAAGCGSSGPTRASTPNSASTSNDAPFQWARCIRAHGVPSFPDPQVTSTPGSTSVRQMVPASVASSPKFKTAQGACRRLQPGPGAGPDHHGPSGAVLLAFARCLRTHGLPAFPDPDREGHISLQMISAAGINLHGPVFLSAAKACVGVTHGAITLADVVALVNGRH